MQLQWSPTPYRRTIYDEVADVPNGLGRYRVRLDSEHPRYRVMHNGKLVATEPTFEAAKRRAEIGADCLLNSRKE